MKSLRSLSLCALLSVSSATARAESQPRVLVSDAGRADFLQRIETVPWMKSAYAELKARVDSYVIGRKGDPDFLKSRLMMHWDTHHTKEFVKGERYVRGEGRAPVPTPHFTGGRDWASEATLGDLDEMRPYNLQDGKVFGIDKKTKKGSWMEPARTGHAIEARNVAIMKIAAEAGLVYWVTREEAYAKFAADIFWTYWHGFSFKEPPTPLDGQGASIIGLTSFEVIHEAITEPAAFAYDFLRDYLKAAGKDADLIQAQFKRLADRIIDGGMARGNWNLNQARNFAALGLTLDPDSAFADGKGREHYMDVVFNAKLPNQLGLNHVVANGYDEKTALWPEAFGYGAGVTETIAGIVALTARQGFGEKLLDSSILQRAAEAQFQLLYPNGLSNGIGDTFAQPPAYGSLELLLAHARKTGDAATERRMGGILAAAEKAGWYDRSAAARGKGLFGLLPLALYVPDVKAEPLPLEEFQTRTFDAQPIGQLVQRNLAADPKHALAATLFATNGGHVHQNGLAIELFGAGIPLAPDPGRGASYWVKEFREYYRQMPAHNAVVVDGKSTDGAPLQAVVMEPASAQKAVSPRFSFAMAEVDLKKPDARQRRLLALVRTSDQGGVYLDIMRSRAKDAAHQSHDYLYHGVGQTVTVLGGDGKPVNFKPGERLGTKHGDVKGYDYFEEQRSAETDGFVATFDVALDDKPFGAMRLWMLPQGGRTLFSAAAPHPWAIERGGAPYPISQLPMPTLIVRQKNDAWEHPFVAVFEPWAAGGEPSIHRVAPLGDVKDAEFLAVEMTGAKGDQFALLNDTGEKPRSLDTAAFQGVFGAIVLNKGNEVTELYLGKGRSIAHGTVKLAGEGDADIAASLRRSGSGWTYSATGPLKISLPGAAAEVSLPAGHDQPVR